MQHTGFSFWLYVFSVNAKNVESDSGLSTTSQRSKRKRTLSAKGKESAASAARFMEIESSIQEVPEDEELYDDDGIEYTEGFSGGEKEMET